MTTGRKKYLDGISKEEYFIREEIKGCKHLIRVLKDCIGIASCESVANLHKRDISRYKSIIKALKKQLPAPILAGETCSVCDFSHEDSLIFPSYCTCCGQKLR